jgi:hypothetical protein
MKLVLEDLEIEEELERVQEDLGLEEELERERKANRIHSTGWPVSE